MAAVSHFRQATNVLDEMGLSYEIPSNNLVHFALVDNSSEIKHMDIRIAVSTDSQTISVYSTAPFVVPDNVLPNMLNLIARTNASIRCGHFELDWEQRKVQLRNNVRYGKCNDIAEVFRGMINRNVHVFNAHIESFYYVSLGADPLTALVDAQRAHPIVLTPSQRDRRRQDRMLDADDIDSMNYEELSLLCEMLGDVKAKGMPAEEAALLKKEAYNKKDLRSRVRRQRKQWLEKKNQSQVPVNDGGKIFLSSPSPRYVNRVVAVTPSPPGKGKTEGLRVRSANSSPLTTTPTPPPLSSRAIAVATPVASPDTDDGNDRCCICMEDFEDGEDVKTLPCLHCFHAGELDKWLTTKRCCPVCNVEVALR